ncbi:MAG: nitroreductase family protein [Oscillospiraceae bacterium]|nr:nitroreductase family protein [Oscillospiraceae bacterium]
MTDFLDLAEKRFSVLEYTKQHVEEDVIQRILKAGLCAPTACNYQPQRIRVIKTDEDRNKLNHVIPSKYYVPAAFLICFDKNKSWTRPMDGKSSGDIDASIVSTHMMLEATDLGLGSIWVMFWSPDKMREEFELESNMEPVALLIVGYKSDEAKPRKGHLESISIEEMLL